MPKFILNDRDFESVKADIPMTDHYIELRKIDKTLYSIFDHSGNSVFECGTFTKTELKTIWQMLTI